MCPNMSSYKGGGLHFRQETQGASSSHLDVLKARLNGQNIQSVSNEPFSFLALGVALGDP